jgi:hypothetical protein
MRPREQVPVAQLGHGPAQEGAIPVHQGPARVGGGLLRATDPAPGPECPDHRFLRELLGLAPVAAQEEREAPQGGVLVAVEGAKAVIGIVHGGSGCGDRSPYKTPGHPPTDAGLHQRGRPRPGGGQVQDPAAGVGDEAAGGVQQPGAQPFGLGEIPAGDGDGPGAAGDLLGAAV